MISDATTKKINDQITLVKLSMVQSKYNHSTDGATSLLINGVIVYHNANTKLIIAFIPDWVITSNFENNSLPKDSTTYGIKSLIEGVNNAYRNKYNNIFIINLNLK